MSAAVDQGRAETSVEQESSAAVPLVEPEAVSGYHVRIEGFEGPFDLLLQLIARRRLEISEVDLADITGEFLVHLARNRDGTFDLETATRFLVVAATLVELKAARLLPVDGEEQLDKILQEARDVLYARLLEYRAFRELSGLLAELLERNEAYAGREVPLEQHFRDYVPPATGSIEPATLAELAAVALSPRLQPRVSIAHLHRTSLTIAEAAASLVARIRSHERRVTFGSLVEGCSRSEQVVHFMALLELYKMGRVELRQDDGWAPLEVACRETACEGFPLRGPSVPTSP